MSRAPSRVPAAAQPRREAGALPRCSEAAAVADTRALRAGFPKTHIERQDEVSRLAISAAFGRFAELHHEFRRRDALAHAAERARKAAARKRAQEQRLLQERMFAEAEQGEDQLSSQRARPPPHLLSRRRASRGPPRTDRRPHHVRSPDLSARALDCCRTYTVLHNLRE